MISQRTRKPGRMPIVAAALMVTGILLVLVLAFVQGWPTGEKTSPVGSDYRRDSDHSNGAAFNQSRQHPGASDASQPDRSHSLPNPDGFTPAKYSRNSGISPGAASEQAQLRLLTSGFSSSNQFRVQQYWPLGARPSPLDALNLILHGNQAFTTDQIKAAIYLPDHATSISVGRAVREQILAFYQERGFAQAVLSEAKTSGPPWTVELTVEEGQVFRLGRLEIVGVSALPLADVLDLYPQIGEIVDWPKLERANSLLLARYRELGYLNVKIEPTAGISTSTSGSFDYRVEIQEGPLYRVRSIEVPPQLQPVFPFHKGDPFHESLLDQFLKSSQVGKEGVLVDRFDREGVVDIAVSIPK